MKKFYFLFSALCFFNLCSAQIIDIPDINLKMRLIALNVDTNSNFQIEFSEALNLTFLDISNQNISSLQGLQYFTNLQYLNCSNNTISNSINFNLLTKLDYLNYSNIQSVTYFNLDYSNISTLILDGLTNLNYLQCTGNPKLGTLSLNGAVNLTEIWATNNKLTVLNLQGLTGLKKLYCSGNQLAALDVSSLTNLESLDCASNLLKSTDFNVSGLINLKHLSCEYNKLVKLNVDPLAKLTYLSCYSNELIDLPVSNLWNLEELYCDGNNISSLKLGSLKKLVWLNCSNNTLPQLYVDGLTSLKGLKCSYNKLAALDVSALTKLESLECFNNQIDTLDLSNSKNLNRLDCSQNQLTLLLIRNGSTEKDYLKFSSNPDLKYVCADENQLNAVQALVTQYGYTNCNINSYCSFKPVGTYYTVEGNNKLDSDNNGCDTQDVSMPNLKFSLSDGTNTRNIIADVNGNYSIPFPEGSHSITPVLEKPAYFSVFPTSVNVSFPVQTAPLKQNFCITPNGLHPDLEIVVLQTVPARPGFNASYKIIYKNKGNIAQSGSVNLSFNDSVLDFIESSPAVNTQSTDNLSWNFTNIKPFESREITFIIKVNAPTATPAVNIGDILAYTATIISSNADETPKDNSFAFNQTVVGSFDPNDKTCLEGTIITPDLIGQYVHYMIRFENTGTYPAQNIVVKDMIDLTKFDISTLNPTSSSHSFVTKISEGNKVEFIFENINLPFDDAHNDGYIAFKIKTKSSLQIGDSFSNDANIYFDCNFPILTNKATSTFKNSALSTQDFDFSRYLILYPNPSDQILNISQNENIVIQSFEIYDVLGQLIIAIPNAKATSNIDISKLKTGNYFIKVKSDKGSSSMKFIKI